MTHFAWALSRILFIMVLILFTIDFPSPSSPASRQQLSKICLAIMLALSGSVFLTSLSLTISSSFGLNSKVRFLKSARGLPSWDKVKNYLCILFHHFSHECHLTHWGWEWTDNKGGTLNSLFADNNFINKWLKFVFNP